MSNTDDFQTPAHNRTYDHQEFRYLTLQEEAQRSQSIDDHMDPPRPEDHDQPRPPPPATSQDVTMIFLQMMQEVTSQLADLRQARENPESYPRAKARTLTSGSIPSRALQSCQVPRGMWRCHATALLRGVAAQWAYNATKDLPELPDWREWIEILLDIFQDKTSQHELRNQLDNLKETGSIREYTHKFLAILGQVESMTKFDQVYMLIREG
jgi:hypothetical protein